YGDNRIRKSDGNTLNAPASINIELSRRASGSVDAKTTVPTPAGYTVYRLADGQPEAEWNELGETIATAYTDENWSTLMAGIYRYAVKAKYNGEILSAPKLTNIVLKDMAFDFTVNLTANSSDIVTGAALVMTNTDNNPEHVYTGTADSTGIVTFAQAWKGTYSLLITKDGYETYTATVEVTAAGQSHNAQLVEIINNPFGLNVQVNGFNAMFTWNPNPFTPFGDDMESHDNFIVSNIGEYTMVDLDGRHTYGMQESINYPNRYYTGSFMVFNPSATEPSILQDNTAPHSGDKYLACFAAVGAPNNDWLILPKNKMEDGVQLSFWAKTLQAADGLERIKVAVSTTGTNAPNDFTIISEGNYIEVPDVWTEYTFDMSDYAGEEVYIAINCVSSNSFALMLDDILVDYVEKSPSPKSFTKYVVYLNGNEVAETTNPYHEFVNLTGGNYIAGVKAVYTSGESGIFNLPFVITDDSGIDGYITGAIRLYPNPTSGQLTIEYGKMKVENVEIYDVTGRLVLLSSFDEGGGGFTVDISHLPSGVYFVKTGNISTKVVKR
ncbi:MAG: choice-of-anchor J domain-containing protein, partial [Cytophagaceae bacterium]|nr:choice-of-anchor J domain-containing protein [Cytophagaceae bacterium]